VLGALLATWGVQLLVSLSEGSFHHRDSENRPDGFGVHTADFSRHRNLFGSAPAFRTLKVNLIDSMKDGARGWLKELANRTRSLLVVFESAVAVMLLIGAGLLVRSLIALQRVDPGFEANNVLTLRIDLARKKYDTPKRARRSSQELKTRSAACLV
jgi:hypothetical protein